MVAIMVMIIAFWYRRGQVSNICDTIIFIGVATLSLPNSPGVPSTSTSDTLVATYNDLNSVEKLLKEHEVAAVILEPVVGNSGFIEPSRDFLRGLRSLTEKYGALLVFDEVMTGFRVAYGGAQEYYGVTPDLTTLGKVIGMFFSFFLILFRWWLASWCIRGKKRNNVNGSTFRTGIPSWNIIWKSTSDGVWNYNSNDSKTTWNL